MPLPPGAKLGSYEILAPLGAGGMGEVYRARDPKLNRDVAIKVLPAALANDADYLTRFQREAQVLASLNHPNIAAIYGLEGHAIVMELVEGETLKGPLPLQKVLTIARQIAEALEAAHDKGIIHRDLKPGNIKLTPEGVVKVLDFGLAKAVERNSVSGADSPTLTMRATEAGLILGTAGYMSPEQAAGKPVDRRADIWSFGVVLYELLTGARLFDGETVSHTLADVLRADIDLTKIPEGPIRELIRRCLDRNLKNRLSHIGEARYIIDHVPATPTTAQSSRTNWLPWGIAATTLIALGFLVWVRPAPAPALPIRFEVFPSAGTRFGAAGEEGGGSAVSPDGRTLAYAARSMDGESQLYLRPLDSLTARPLAGTEGANRPFWSPDSKSLAFVAGGKLKRLDIAGGVPFTLTDAHLGRGGSWTESGDILFADQVSDIRSIAASGGTPSSVTHLNKDTELSHYYPQILPGGKSFLYLMRTRESLAPTAKTAINAGIFVGSLEGKPPVLLVRSAYKAVYDPASQLLLYTQSGPILLGRHMELDPPRLTGDPVVIADGVSRSRNNGYLDFSISSNGILFYSKDRSHANGRFAWRDRAGNLLETIGKEFGQPGNFALSPDGTRAAYSAPAGPDTSAGTWIVDLGQAGSSRVVQQNSPALKWSPDGKYLYWLGADTIMRKASDGSGSEESVYKHGAPMLGIDMSPDGRNIIFPSGNALFVLPLTGGRHPEKIEEPSSGGPTAPRFSPDGRWVAYADFETGRREVAIRGFPDKRGKWVISANGGNSPAWRADGKELFWLNGNNLMATEIEATATALRAGPPKSLFTVTAPRFQPSNDGRRFLVFEPSTAASADSPMVVVQNWAAGLGK